MGRSASVIRRAIDSGRGRVPFLFGLAALIFVPLGLLDAVQEDIGTIDSETFSDFELLATLAGAAANTVSALLGEVLFAGAVAIAVVSTPPGVDPSLREIVGRTRWGALVAIDLLFTLGVVVGILLLVLPGIIFFGRYVLSAPIAEIEERGVRDSFRRSAELGRGARRLVLGLMLPAFVLGDLLTDLFKWIAERITSDSLLVDWIAASGGEVLTNPIVALLAVALVLELGARPAHPDPQLELPGAR